MNKILIFIALVFLFIGCEKSDIEDFDLTTIYGWAKIDFKTNYTIQVPQEFLGEGMGGFEGNTFFKYSADFKIMLSAGYCSSLFCHDFGDTFKNPEPKSIQVVNTYSKRVTLDQIEYFHQKSEIMGIFYFSKTDTASGRLYWKDNGVYKQALEVQFDLAKLNTINQIIETIKSK